MKKKYKGGRSRKAMITAELPIILWILFIGIAFPVLDLATTFLRISFLYAGVHYASISAARAGSFSAPLDGKPSAQDETASKLNQIQKLFTGLSVANVNTAIVVIKNDTLAKSSQNVPLALPADQSANTYQIEVAADCSADPLFPIPLPIKVSGLNAPLTMHIAARQYCENPQGLTL